MSTIGELPSDIIHKIVELMPIQDAARSSTLSKKCRQIWSTQPYLVFDSLFFHYVSNKGASAASIIHKILMQHTGPILGFHVISNVHKLTLSDLDRCMVFVSNHGIQNITIDVVNNEKYALPDGIFTCSTLTCLKLGGCIFKLPPPDFRGFDKLISLELYYVTINSKFFESLISHCPLLEHLLLHHIFCDVIEINAPMLRSFDFRGIITSIFFKHVPSLTKLSLVGVNMGGPRICDIGKKFQSFVALEHLHLNAESIKFLTAGEGEVPTKLPYDLNCVKHVYLSVVHPWDSDILHALCLISSFPYLQYLKIQVAYDLYYDDVDDNSIPALKRLVEEGFSDVTFSRLKEVKLEGYIKDCRSVMQLIKLLLAKTPVPVRMLI